MNEFFLGLMTLTDLLPKILLALLTTAFSDVYKRICRWLTNRGKKKKQNRIRLIILSVYDRKLSRTTKTR